LISDYSNIIINPFFIEGASGKNFALELLPSEKINITKAVLYFPPFAEEMNKTRRMAALQARALASQGIQVIQLDPFGTGDSEGDFSEADWEIWSTDMQKAVNKLEENNIENIIFWGCRLGILLALYTASKIKKNIDFVFWQPVVKGEIFMTQFMRLKLASDMMNSNKKLTIKDLRSILESGTNIEVAGYSLSPALVDAVDRMEFSQLLPASNTTINWFEITPDLNMPQSPANKKIIDMCKESGIKMSISRIEGEAFWTTPEISEVPELIEQTTKIICGH